MPIYFRALTGDRYGSNLKAIATIFKTKAPIGKNVTKDATKQLLPKARILHFAIYGLLDVRGLGRAIALAPISND